MNVHQQILLASGLPISSLRLRVITFNLGDNKKSQQEWVTELKLWKELNQFDYDLLSFAVQEDSVSTSETGKLIDALTEMLAENGYILAVSDESKPLVSTMQFSVKAATFLKSGIYNRSFIAPKNYVAKKTICLGNFLKKIACTKASVGVTIRLGAPYNLRYTFIGSHMPIETKKEDLGFAARLEAMSQTVNAVVKPLVFPINQKSNTLLVWAGDLNFRKDLEKNDQLTSALAIESDAGQGKQSGFGIGLKENIDLLKSIQPTCKLVACKGDQCPKCRNHPETADPTCYDSGAKHGKEAAVTRLPSNCDRVLYRFWPNKAKLNSVAYNAFVESAILNSDHNAVKADFEFQQ